MINYLQLQQIYMTFYFLTIIFLNCYLKKNIFVQKEGKLVYLDFIPIALTLFQWRRGEVVLERDIQKKKREKRITFHGREKSMPLDFIFLSFFEFFINYSLTAPRKSEIEGRRERKRRNLKRERRIIFLYKSQRKGFLDICDGSSFNDIHLYVILY